jgi:hypothetical protein
MQGLNLKKLKEIKVTEQCQVKISNMSAALENLGGGGETKLRKIAWSI